jgi:ribosomal protein L24E
MVNTGDKCDYCGEDITDETMDVLEEHDAGSGETVYFCNKFCRILSTRTTKENKKGHKTN